MLAIRSVRSGAAAQWKSGLAYGLWQLLKTAVISLFGAVYLVALLNHVTYSLVLAAVPRCGDAASPADWCCWVVSLIL